MSIFHHHHMQFTQHDPLADGLGDMIADEQREAEAFHTLDDISGDELAHQWEVIARSALDEAE